MRRLCSITENLLHCINSSEKKREKSAHLIESTSSYLRLPSLDIRSLVHHHYPSQQSVMAVGGLPTFLSSQPSTAPPSSGTTTKPQPRDPSKWSHEHIVLQGEEEFTARRVCGSGRADSISCWVLILDTRQRNSETKTDNLADDFPDQPTARGNEKPARRVGVQPSGSGGLHRSAVTETTGIIDEARLDAWLAWPAVVHVRGVRSQNG